MKRLVSSLAMTGALFGAAVAFVAPSVVAQAADPGGDQGEARRERKAGNILSIRQIEQMVLPRMNGMQYLGPDYDPAAMAYRLKFIQNGKIFFVDVDARTGRVIGQSH
ncbi:hypothetical protein CA833_13345 [Novosphingobium sp. KA1]|nr:hypothetical protein CA833_13345 [Novosphingobium sp. KA1]